jgi:hypothetical protein
MTGIPSSNSTYANAYYALTTFGLPKTLEAYRAAAVQVNRDIPLIFKISVTAGFTFASIMCYKDAKKSYKKNGFSFDLLLNGVFGMALAASACAMVTTQISEIVKEAHRWEFSHFLGSTRQGECLVRQNYLYGNYFDHRTFSWYEPVGSVMSFPECHKNNYFRTDNLTEALSIINRNNPNYLHWAP